MTHEIFDRDYWEERYGAPGFTWTGNPNAVLVEETVSLTPGRALDIGSGEGGDAIWLASNGWHVTGVDISQNALDKAAERAGEAGVDVTWELHDLLDWAPTPKSFELVTAHFMHLAEPERGVLFRSLAAAVAPGGSLLIVGHDVTGHDEHRAHMAALMFGVGDVLAAIDGQGLNVVVAESRERATGGLRDVVVRATRAA